MVVLVAMAPSSGGEKKFYRWMKTMEKNLQADSSLCLPHWLQRQSKNRFQLRLSCGKGRHVEDRKYQQRQIGGMIGLLRRKLGAWRSQTSEESLYAGATSGILREEWPNSIFPYSCVWAKDAEYGVGRVDWVKLLCTNKSGNGPCRKVFENNLDRVPDGVADITGAKDQGKQLQAVQTHDNGSGENQEPLCAGGQQGDCEKILQDSGNEICGSICDKQNCSGAGTEGEHACLDFAGAEKFCHVGFDVATFPAEASCHDCCLASPCPCFGFPDVQDRYSAEACDSCSIEWSDCSQQECATAIALPLCQASSSQAGSCTEGNFSDCSLNAFLFRFGVPRPQGDDFPLECVKADFAYDVLEDGRSAQVICHFDLEHDDEHAIGPRDTSPLPDPPRVVQQGYLDGSAVEDPQGDASTGFHLLQGPSTVRVLSSADHVRRTEDDRILQVICHFDLEHDDEQAVGSRVSKPWHAPPKVVQQGHHAGSAVEDGHIRCTCPLKLQQGRSVLCHCSQVGASLGFLRDAVDLGCDFLGGPIFSAQQALTHECIDLGCVSDLRKGVPDSCLQGSTDGSDVSSKCAAPYSCKLDSGIAVQECHQACSQFAAVPTVMTSGLSGTLSDCPCPRPPGFRPLPPDETFGVGIGHFGAALGCPSPRTLGFSPSPAKRRVLCKVCCSPSDPCSSSAVLQGCRWAEELSSFSCEVTGGNTFICHFDLEHEDGERLFDASAMPLTASVDAQVRVSTTVEFLDAEAEHSCTSDASKRQPWAFVPQCLLGVVSWMCEPSRVISHCYLLATRVGEASNPGPDSQANNGNAIPAFDIGNLLGPNFGAMLQQFIQQQIHSAVQTAVQEAMKQLQTGFQLPNKDAGASQDVPPPKRRRKGKGEGTAQGEGQQHVQVQTSAGAKDQGKGKVQGKPADPKVTQQEGRGGEKPATQKGKAGKGKGTNTQNPPPQTKTESQDGWIKVERKRDDTKDAHFELRQQDWNAPLMSFGSLAKSLQDTKGDEVCRGVILCPRKEIETARALISGTTKKYALLLIVLAKEFADKPKDLQSQKVPGKLGNLLKAQDAYLQQAVSAGQTAPQPTGISSAPQKIATKATAVLFVKVPKTFTEGTVWQKFVEKPQRQIAQWTAAHHVLCIDCFNWAEEQLQGGRRQVHGVIRVAQADVSTLLAHSGEQGIFLQQPRDQVTGQHVEWAERLSKQESDADYLVRVNRARGDLGLVCRDVSLGWRRPNDATTPVRRVWILEHAPKTWDLQQVAGLLQDQFSDINMFRQVHRGAWKNFIFRAACKRGSDVDLVPVTVLLDEPGGSNAPVTLWAKIAPPKHVECKQRQIRGGAVPFFDKPSLFDPVTVATAPTKAEDKAAGEQCKGEPPPDPKRTCSAKRPVPEGTILHRQPADGDCLFHTFSAGLHALRKDKESEPIHPHELRARTVAHIRRYTERYKPQWEADGKLGPTGKAVDSWDDFLEAISKPGAYAGDAELKAMCRIFDIRVILVPEAPQFPVCVFHRKASAKRTLAIFHTHHHFDYLAPADKTYPDEITQVSADPSGGFLVGGKLSARTAFTRTTRSRTAKTTWTSQAGQSSHSKLCKSQASTSQAKKTDRKERQVSRRQASVASEHSKDGRGQPTGNPSPSLSGLGLGSSPLVAPPPLPSSRHLEDRDPKKPNTQHLPGERRSFAGTVWTDPDEKDEVSSQDLEGCQPGRRIAAPCSHRQAAVLPEDFIFRCQHCPFQKQVTSIEHFRMTRHKHMKGHHDGADLPGPVRRPKVQQVPGGVKNMAWKCPRCRLGISHTLKQAISQTVFAQMRRDHRASHHPDISKEEWSNISRVKTLPFGQQPLEFRRKFAEGCRRRQLGKGVMQEVRAPRFPGFQTFVWPVAKHLPGLKGQPKIKRSKQPIHRISLEHGWKCQSCEFASRSLIDVRAHASKKCAPPRLAHVSRERRLENFRAIREWIANAKLQKEEAATLSAAVDSATAAINPVSSVGQSSSAF